MSQWDVAEIIKQLLVKYPEAEVHKEICLATQVRQEAVAEQAKECDLILVVGDPKATIPTVWHKFRRKLQEHRHTGLQM